MHLGLADRGHHWPNQLSGGQQQRVVIARAMVNDPAVILADEPTGSLDSSTSEEIMSLFEDLHHDGRTLVVITHATEVAARAQRQITLHDGRTLDDDGATRKRFPLTEGRSFTETTRPHPAPKLRSWDQ
jgi:putative ABC transport system ATP-binding protein